MAIICIVGLVTTVYAGELIKNGNFDSGTDNWVYWTGNGGDATAPVVENGEAKIKVNNVGNETWSIQFRQDNTPLVKGKNYIVKFDVRSTAPRKIRFMLEKNGGAQPYPVYYGPVDVDITTDMKTYTYECTIDTTEPDAHLIFCLGVVGRIGKPHTIFFDNVSLVEKD
jgi:hypothetical protein